MMKTKERWKWLNSVETVKYIEMETNRIPRIIQLIMKNYRNQPALFSYGNGNSLL